MGENMPDNSAMARQRRAARHCVAGRSTGYGSIRAPMDGQRGVAIITAILVIALGTISMVAITASQQLDMQRERNEGLIQQARSLGYSGERFASAILYRDVQAGQRGDSDSLEDDWAQPIPPVPIDNASITGCVVDMQGRFNLNNLINEQGGVQPAHAAQLKRLLRQLNIDETKADAIVDWVDSDIDFTVPDGAEDDYYTGLEVGYRAANAPFVSVSELQLVKGFSSAIEEETEDYALLLPHISVIPHSFGTTAVNVNTATPEVLASLSDELLVANTLSRWETGAYEDYPQCENIFDLDAEIAVEGKDVTPYESRADFDTAAAFDPDPQANNNDNNAQVAATENTATANDSVNSRPDVAYDVRSSFFQVRIDVEAEGIRLTQYTLLERGESGQTRVIYRSRDTL